MSKFLGGFSDVEVDWISPTAIRIRFQSVNTGMLTQLYYGRRLVAETVNINQRQLFAQIDGGRWQNQLTLLAVSGDDVAVDHGEDLPPDAYNSVKLTYDSSGLPADTQALKFYRGDTPGGAVNTTTPIKVLPFDGTSQQEAILPPFPGTGSWNVRAVAFDDKPLDGNAGSNADQTVSVIAAPPDFDQQFTASVAANVATITATIPED